MLDFGRYIAGPYCAALLADLGADVIRIERRGGGEDRWVAPVGADGVGPLYLVMNRNKRAMTLDPACPEGREIVRKLVATTDVVVANLAPEVLRSLALDLDSLRLVKPDIIRTTVTAFGAGGPWSLKHGFDGIGQVMCGSAYLTGTPEQPMRPAGPLYSPQQALDDAHIRAAGLLRDTDYPGLPRPAPLAPTPVDLPETPGRFRHPAPTLGEHTDAILAELAYGAEEIARLRTRGVI